MDSEPVGVQAFSDLVALSLSVASGRKKIPMLGIFLTTAAFGSASLWSLDRGHPVRGGIELDVAWRFGRPDAQIEIYGRALAKAHRLESKVAGYPRIVLGRNLLEYIELWAKLPDSNPDTPYTDRANRWCAELVLGILVVDDDGERVVDPFADWYWPGEKRSLRRRTAERCLGFAEGRWTKFAVRGDTRLADRYSRLISFLGKYGIG